MSIQTGAHAPYGIGLPEERTALVFTNWQLEKIHAASIAYHRLFELRATGPEWPAAYADWQYLAESVAVAAIHMLEAMEVRHD